MPAYCNNGYTDSVKVSANGSAKLGSLEDEGIQLYVSSGAFKTAAQITLDALPRSEISQYEQEDYEIVGSVVTVSADDYDGKYFAEPVVLSMKLPVSQMDISSNNGDYFGAYYNEAKKTWTLVEPDSIDIKNGIVKFSLMALETGQSVVKTSDTYNTSTGITKLSSPSVTRLASDKKGKATIAIVNPSDKKTVEKYLDDWCTAKARQDVLEEEGREAFQPYVNAIAQKMAAEKNARNALAEVILVKLISNINTDTTKGRLVSGGLDFTNTVGWGAYRAIESGDSSEFKNALGTAASKALTATITENGDYVNYVGAAGSIGTIAGQISGGDYTSAIQTTEEAVLSCFPTANVLDKAAKYVVRKVDMDYTMWKKDRIDDLYVKWRDGFETHPGTANSVEYRARDFDDLMIYMDYDTHANKIGFGNADMMLKRIYDSDQKINEQVQRYGFGSRSYNQLSDDEKKAFVGRVTNGLKEYFEQRYKTESKAQKMLSNETEFINDLYSYGFFDSDRHTSLFHDYGEYNTERRLNTLYAVRKMLAQLVDADQQKKQFYNDSYLVSEYANFRDQFGTSEAKEKMKQWLKDHNLLKKGITISEDTKVTVDDIVGTWNVTASFSDIDSIAIDWLTALFRTIISAVGEDGEEATAEIDEFRDNFKNGINNIPQILTISKTSDNRVKVEVSTPDSDSKAVYNGSIDDNGLLKLSLGSGNGNDEGISLDIQNLEYKFYKTNGYVTLDGTYRISTITFSATYDYTGEKVYTKKQA